MKFQGYIFDLDDTIYTGVENPPDEEVSDKVWPRYRPLSRVPKGNFVHWQPYEGIEDLLREIGKERLGIITNGPNHCQRNALRLLGLYGLVNPKLVFTSFGEAEKILNALF